MKKFQPALALGLVFALAGAVIAQFFPEVVDKIFKSDDVLGSVGRGIGNAVSKPFSEYRNELMVKYSAVGFAAGAVIGVVLALIGRK